MKPTKPDRWERIVEDLEFIRDCGGKDTPLCASADVLDLLRKEHAAVVRMVKKEFSKMEAVTLDRTNSNGRIVMAHYKALQCRDILDQLTRRAK